MNEEKSLVDAEYILQKFPGKGGWTYASIPEINSDKKNPFGWVKVKGSIDGYKLKHYKLMPMGDGNMFLPVKSEIRKKIKKGEGDFVRIILFRDDSPIEVPQEIIDCFMYESPHLYDKFIKQSDGEKKALLDWVYSAKTDETKVRRIAAIMDNLQNQSDD